MAPEASLVVAADVSDPTAPRVRGQYAVRSAGDIALADELLYVAANVEGSSGLLALDVSDPDALRSVSFLPLSSGGQLALHGHYVFAAGLSGICALDVADPRQPQVTGCLALTDVYDITITGDYAYVVLRSGEIIIVSITDPANLTVIDKVAATGGTRLTAVGQRFLLTHGHGAISALDISDPSRPVRTGFYDAPGNTPAIAVSKDLLYVAASEGGLRVLSLAALTAMREVAAPLGPPTGRLAIQDDRAYIAAKEEGLRIVDIRDRLHPFVIGAKAVQGFARDVAVAGQYAYVAAQRNWNTGEAGGLRILDVGDPASPRLVGSLDASENSIRMKLHGSLVYIADGEYGLRIIDVADPTQPREISVYDTPTEADGVDVAVLGGHTYAYVADVFTVRILDVTDPAQPYEVSFIPKVLGGLAVEVVVRDNYAYVSDSLPQCAGLYVFDVSTPSSPTLVSYTALEFAGSVTLAENRAYVIGGGSLNIYDISVLEHPVKLSAYAIGSSATTAAVLGGLVYVTAQDGLHVISKDRVASPMEIGALVYPVRWVQAAAGHYIYVTEQKAMVILDASDPQYPIEVGRYELQGRSGSIVVSGQYAYLVEQPVQDRFTGAYSRSGLHIIDVSNPVQPNRVGFIAASMDNQPLFVQEQRAFARVAGHLALIDVREPTRPTLIGVYEPIDTLRDVSVQGDLVYAVTGNSDRGCVFHVVDVSVSSAPIEVGSLPFADFYCWRMTGSGHYAFLDARPGSPSYQPYYLYTIDVSDPSSPQVTAASTSPGGQDQVIYGQNLVVAGGGLRLYDLSDPSHITLSASLKEPYPVSWMSSVSAGELIYLNGYSAKGMFIVRDSLFNHAYYLPMLGGSR